MYSVFFAVYQESDDENIHCLLLQICRCHLAHSITSFFKYEFWHLLFCTFANFLFNLVFFEFATYLFNLTNVAFFNLAFSFHFATYFNFVGFGLFSNLYFFKLLFLQTKPFKGVATIECTLMNPDPSLFSSARCITSQHQEGSQETTKWIPCCVAVL